MFLSSLPLSPQYFRGFPICCWVDSERASSRMIPGGSRAAVFGTVGKRPNRYPTRPYKQIEQKIINTEIKMK